MSLLPKISIKEFAKLESPECERSQKYIIENTFCVVSLKNSYVAINKPTINNKFCFGYRHNDLYSEEEANKKCKKSKTFEYFYKENMKNFDKYIEVLKKCIKYNNKSVDIDGELVKITILRTVMPKISYIFYRPEEFKYRKDRRATIEELNEVLKAYEALRDYFDKQLHTWWNKYGSNYIKSWTYTLDW